MGPFDLVQKKGSKPIQAQPLKIRKQPVVAPVSASSSCSKILLPTQIGKSNGIVKAPTARARQQSSTRRSSPAQTRLESDAEDEPADEQYLGLPRKRVKLGEAPVVDSERQIRSINAFVQGKTEDPAVIHAADVASLEKPLKYKSAFFQDPLVTSVSLQYPSASRPERYALVEPIQRDDLNPLEEIMEVASIVTKLYLPPTERSILEEEEHGLLRRLKRAITRRAGRDCIDFIHEWNDIVTRLRKDDTIATVMDSWDCVDSTLVERVLTQTYARTVSPRINSLRQYENGTDNIYGELLPKFVSEILKKDVRMTSNQVFVDLGSGVGNVVLQAALQIGCESWGCEMMENACDLAALQHQEFTDRCHLWGLALGKIHLERGDFLESRVIGRVLKRADVILVNNQAFTPELNEALTNLFLDAKEGCHIVSLKSFVPSGHKITSRNLYRACNVLDVREKRYYSYCVSWTNAPGTYYISVKDSSRVEAFAKKQASEEPTTG